MGISKVAALAGPIIMPPTACSPLTYSRAGTTREDVSRDLSECAEIATHEAFREIEVADFRLAILLPRLHHRNRIFHGDIGLGVSELQRRYRRVCMPARGYRLSPIDDWNKC